MGKYQLATLVTADTAEPNLLADVVGSSPVAKFQQFQVLMNSVDVLIDPDVGLECPLARGVEALESLLAGDLEVLLRIPSVVGTEKDGLRSRVLDRIGEVVVAKEVAVDTDLVGSSHDVVMPRYGVSLEPLPRHPAEAGDVGRASVYVGGILSEHHERHLQG